MNLTSKIDILSIKKLFLLFIFVFNLCIISGYSFADTMVPTIPGSDDVKSVSLVKTTSGNTLNQTKSLTISVLHSIKILILGLAIVYLIYAGIQMILSMGDTTKLTAAKRQLYYSIIAFVFVNIPNQIYDLFSSKEGSIDSVSQSAYSSKISTTGSSILVNYSNWATTVENGILQFIQVLIFGLSVFMFTVSGMRLIGSGGDEEKRKEAKSKFVTGTLGLVFLGVNQAWVEVVYNGDITKGQGIFAQLANMALFFSGPTGIFFLSIGGYKYITSGGDAEKAKKAKSILTNTLLAVVILLASYGFLKDLGDFKVN